MGRFYLWIAGAESGPYTVGQMRSMWAGGSLTLDTLYCTENDGNWRPLSMIAEDLERSASSYPEPRMTSDNRHVKATTELTSKSIKATMLLFGLAFAACVIGAITQDEPVSAYCIFGALLSALGYLITKIARWWENE